MMSVKDSSIWELLNEYADIRDGLEDTLQSFENLQFEVTSALEDIQDEIDTLKEHRQYAAPGLSGSNGPNIQNKRMSMYHVGFLLIAKHRTLFISTSVGMGSNHPADSNNL